MEDTWFRRAWALACATCIALWLVYLGLVPLGHWQADEYQTFGSLQESVYEFVRWRISSWSPRPLSEIFIYAYGRLVQASGQPMVIAALLPCWTLLGAVVLFTALRRREHRQWALVPLAMLPMFLLGHPVADLFYWPMAALAYMPTLAGIILVFVANECLQAQKTSRWVVIGLALVLAASCSEVGSLFVLAFVASWACAGWVADGRERSLVFLPALGLPALAAGMLLLKLADVRIGHSGEVFGDAGIAHHWTDALAKTVPRAMREWVVLDPSRAHDRSMVLGLATKALFAMGAYRLAGRDGDGSRQRMRFAIALAALGMVPATIFAAYYQFGSPCCERHAIFRQCMVYLGLAAAASWTAGWSVRHGRKTDPRPWLGPACLLGSLLLAASTSIGKIAHDYGAYSEIAASRDATWRSGKSAGGVVVLTPVTGARIVGNDPELAAGVLHKDDPWTRAVLSYFGKDSLRVIDKTVDVPEPDAP